MSGTKNEKFPLSFTLILPQCLMNSKEKCSFCIRSIFISQQESENLPIFFEQAALMWSKKYCDTNGQKLSEVLNGFLDYINFHMIPANVLMKEIHPLGIVPYHIIMNALAYQADPTSVEPIKHTKKEVTIQIQAPKTSAYYIGPIEIGLL